jgi:hypothetical protein
MKKTYVYFLVPLLALIAFGAIYWNFLSTFDAKEEASRKAAKEKTEAKLRLEAQNREKAIKDALDAQERRKKEREAKEAKEAKDREVREAAIEARNKARNDREKFSRQVDRLKSDVRVEKEAIAKLEDTKKGLLQDEVFLKDYVKKAEANEKQLTDVIEKIDAADKAAAERAKAEAMAAKAKNNT